MADSPQMTLVLTKSIGGHGFRTTVPSEETVGGSAVGISVQVGRLEASAVDQVGAASLVDQGPPGDHVGAALPVAHELPGSPTGQALSTIDQEEAASLVNQLGAASSVDHEVAALCVDHEEAASSVDQEGAALCVDHEDAASLLDHTGGLATFSEAGGKDGNEDEEEEEGGHEGCEEEEEEEENEGLDGAPLRPQLRPPLEG